MKTLEELTEASSLSEFIEYFDSIPEDMWTAGYYEHPVSSGKCCVRGHLGIASSKIRHNSCLLDQRLCTLIEDKLTDNYKYNGRTKLMLANNGQQDALAEEPNPEGVKDRVITFLKSLL